MYIYIYNLKSRTVNREMKGGEAFPAFFFWISKSYPKKLLAFLLGVQRSMKSFSTARSFSVRFGQEHHHRSSKFHGSRSKHVATGCDGVCQPLIPDPC